MLSNVLDLIGRIFISSILSTVPTPNITAGNLKIGSYPLGGQNWNGYIDEVRVWSTARSQQEIQSVMHSSLRGTEAGLIGNWAFDENEGNVAHDKSTYENHGEIFNGFGWSHNLGKPGIWSDGPVSSLLFKTEKQKGDFQLEIFCSPYVSKKDKTLNFDIFVNDIFSKKISLKKDNKENIKILIENNSIENNEVKIDFHFKNLTSPLKELKSPDSRKLGILVESIYIRPI